MTVKRRGPCSVTGKTEVFNVLFIAVDFVPAARLSGAAGRRQDAQQRFSILSSKAILCNGTRIKCAAVFSRRVCLVFQFYECSSLAGKMGFIDAQGLRGNDAPAITARRFVCETTHLKQLVSVPSHVQNRLCQCFSAVQWNYRSIDA